MCAAEKQLVARSRGNEEWVGWWSQSRIPKGRRRHRVKEDCLIRHQTAMKPREKDYVCVCVCTQKLKVMWECWHQRQRKPRAASGLLLWETRREQKTIEEKYTEPLLGRPNNRSLASKQSAGERRMKGPPGSRPPLKTKWSVAGTGSAGRLYYFETLAGWRGWPDTHTQCSESSSCSRALSMDMCCRSCLMPINAQCDQRMCCLFLEDLVLEAWVQEKYCCCGRVRCAWCSKAKLQTFDLGERKREIGLWLYGLFLAIVIFAKVLPGMTNFLESESYLKVIRVEKGRARKTNLLNLNCGGLAGKLRVWKSDESGFCVMNWRFRKVEGQKFWELRIRYLEFRICELENN